jgi:uncharacterized DUF497 family protein
MNTWDEKKRLQNLKEHEIDFAVLEFFFDQPVSSEEDRNSNHDELRIRNLGLLNGEVVVLIWTPTEECMRIISCRYGERDETREYFKTVLYPSAD